jgi:hypothetical protein
VSDSAGPLFLKAAQIYQWLFRHSTLISRAGTVVHNGQLFFDEDWNDRVFATQPYTDNAHKRTFNKDDILLEDQSADGNNAFLDLELLGECLEEGILGYISTYFVVIDSCDCTFISIYRSVGRELLCLLRNL